MEAGEKENFDLLFGNIEHLLLLLEARPRGRGCTHQGRGRLGDLLGNILVWVLLQWCNCSITYSLGKVEIWHMTHCESEPAHNYSQHTGYWVPVNEHSLYATSFVRRTWLCPSCGSGTLEPPELLDLWININMTNKHVTIFLGLSLYFQSTCWKMHLSSNWLRSWILRRMKKMRMAMRTMAMPAPITIPIIWWEKEERRRGADECTESKGAWKTMACTGCTTIPMECFNL